MKHISILLLMAIFSINSAFAGIGAEMHYKAFAPMSIAKTEMLQSGTRQMTYYVMEKGIPLDFDVNGPTTVKIRTRAEYQQGSSQISYEGQVWEGDNLMADRKVKASISALTVPRLNVGVYNDRDIIFKVPPGKHSFRLWLKSDKIERYFVKLYKAEEPMGQ